MQSTIERLRLLLATIEGKQAKLSDRLHQFELQLERASAAAVRSGSVEAP